MLKTIEVFNEPGEAQALTLFPADVKPAADPQVDRVRQEKTRQFGPGWLGWSCGIV